MAPDGSNVYVVGSSSHAVSDGAPDVNESAWDYLLLSYEIDDGHQDWAKRYNGTANGKDEATAVVVAPDSSKLFVTGRACHTGWCDTNSANPPQWVGSFNWTTVALEADGDVLWKRYVDGSGAATSEGANDAPYGIAINANGTRVFVGGTVYDSSSNFKVVSYSVSTGALQWSATYDGPATAADEGYLVAVSPDGARVAVAGRSMGSGTGWDYATLVYNAWTGAHVWTARYDGTASGSDAPRALAFSTDSDTVYVAGVSDGSGGADDDFFTIAYDTADGDVVWSQRENGPGLNGNFDDAINAMAVDPDGDYVYVTGPSQQGSATGYDMWTFAYNEANGNEAWSATHDRDVVVGTSTDFSYGIAVSPDGERLAVVGDGEELSGVTGFTDYATVAYDSDTGSEQWVVHYNGPGAADDKARVAAFSPDSQTLLVSGNSWGTGTAYDVATLGYTASNGNQIWLERFNGASNDGIFGQIIT